jgi:type I restriction-modification system DNA methylase subunit
MSSVSLLDQVGANIQEKSAMIWNVTDNLYGSFKAHEYGLVILPMTVIKRFHDCLQPTHQGVLEKYEEVKKIAVRDGFLCKAAGFPFYNISKYTFETLLADPENIEANFRDYLNGFSANVQDILSKFEFENIIKRMVEAGSLYQVIKEFAGEKGYLGPDRVKAVDMGYIFEDLVRRFSESYDEEAGSGPSEIRRYLIENDWLDTIVQLPTDTFMNTGISTYIWICNKSKPEYRAGKVQLIDASKCCEPRRKSIGNKRVDITDRCRNLIVTAYGEYKDKVYKDEDSILCKSKICDAVEFGYNKIIIERPLLDTNGKPVIKSGKPVPDPGRHDSENVPLDQDIDAYFKREVLPYAGAAWIDRKKTKVGYEIPFTRYFYTYVAPEPSESIAERITMLNSKIETATEKLFGGKA